MTIPSGDDLVFKPEGNQGHRLAGIALIALGLVSVGVTLFLAFNPLVFGVGLLLVVIGGIGFLPAARSYPRLRLSGGRYAWVEGMFNSSPVLDLAELGEAQVVVYTLRRAKMLYLGFLRREEEQSLLDIGKPIPTNDFSAFYKFLPLSGLIPWDLERAQEIADFINARRPVGEFDLTPQDRQHFASAVATRQFVYVAGLIVMTGLFFLVAFILGEVRH